MRAAFADLPDMPASGPLNWWRDVGAIRVIGLDGLDESRDGGALAGETLGFLCAALAGYGPEVRVICGHVHRHGRVLACGDRPLDAHAMPADYRPGAPEGYIDEPGGFLVHDRAGGFRSTHIPVAPEDGPFPF